MNRHGIDIETHDGHIAMSVFESVQAEFKGRDEVRIDLYPGVDHGFNCWGRAMYNPKAAALARGRSLAFLAKTVCWSPPVPAQMR